MNKLTLEVALDPVDSVAKPEVYIIALSIKSEKGIIRITNQLSSCFNNVYEITIQADEFSPIRKLWDLPPNSAQFIVCTACSLSNLRILFSPIVYRILHSHTEEERSANQPPKCYPAIKVQVSRTSLNLEENKVIFITERLIYVLFDEIKEQHLKEMNIRESIYIYQSALLSVNKYQRFLFLFHSLEKAVNCEEDSSGIEFDKKASNLTRISEKEVKEIRQFCDRIKHVIRNANDMLTMENSIENYSKLVMNLKTAADSAILSRINESIDKL